MRSRLAIGALVAAVVVAGCGGWTCSGNPKTCQPVADVAIPAGGSAYANDPIVSGSRVYVTIPTPNPSDPPVTHVLSLPGDVG